MTSNKRVFLLSVIVFILAFSVRCYWIGQKAGLHVDEVSTGQIAFFTNFKYNHPLPEGIFYKGSDIKRILYPESSGIKSAVKDILTLRVHNEDVSHTNLYYSALRLYSFNAGTMDLQKFINYGCSLNLIFFTFSFWIMYKLLKGLFKGDDLIPVGLAAAFLNTGTISMTLFIRPYELQTLALIILTYVFVLVYQEKKLINTKNAVLFPICGAFAMLAGYFSAVYAGILGLIIMVKLVKNKQYKVLGFLATLFMIAVCLTLISYPDYFTSTSGQRVQRMLPNIYANSIVGTALFSVILTIFSLLNFLLYMPVIVMLLICFNKGQEREKLPLIIFFAAVASSLVIEFASPYKILRYIAPLFPMLSLIIPYALSFAEGHKRKIIGAVIFGIYLIFSFTASVSESYDTIHVKDKLNLKMVGANIENTYREMKQISSAYGKNPDLPVVIIYDASWRANSYLYHLNDNQFYSFGLYEKTVPKLPMIINGLGHCYVINSSPEEDITFSDEFRVKENFKNDKIFVKELEVK